MSDVTLRDYFAAHAPEIPDWFSISTDQQPVQYPARLDMVPESTKKYIESLVLPEDRYEEYRRLKMEMEEPYHKWLIEQKSRRYFAWRWHYADMMIEGRENDDNT